MTARLPAAAELRFVRNQTTRTVHLQVVTPVWACETPPEAEAITLDGTGRFLAALAQPTVVLCGARTWPYDPGATPRWQHTGRFSDDALCRKCYQALHPDDRPRAFEHEVPA